MTTRDSFTHAIRAKAHPIWDRELKHPFVRGLGDGTLPIDRFRFYLAQDYVFLIEYCRVLALAAAKARDLQAIGVFARLLDETLNTEMQLHRDYCHRLGICGPGNISLELAPYFDHVDAIDPSAPMLALGRALDGGRNRNINWIEVTAESAKLNGPYDLVTAGASIHWIRHEVLFPKLAAAIAALLARRRRSGR